MVKEEKKVEKKIKKEISKQKKNVTKKTPEKKVIKRKPKVETPKENEVLSTEPFLENIEVIKEKKNKKILTKLELIVIFVFSIIMLILLCNRTFFRRNYKTSRINIDIPLLMFFKSDSDNKLVLSTLRKTQYVQDFFDEKLNDMTRYSCNGYTFYYDDINKYAIYDVKIKKDFIVKTVTINYASGNANCLCNANSIGKEAEEVCNK